MPRDLFRSRIPTFARLLKRWQSAKVVFFHEYWKVRKQEIRILSTAAARKSVASLKLLVLRDTTLFKAWLPEDDLQRSDAAVAVRAACFDVFNLRAWPHKVIIHVLEFLCLKHIGQAFCEAGSLECAVLSPGFHQEQCSLQEFCAHIASHAIANIDFAAIARTKPPNTQTPADVPEAPMEDDEFVCEAEDDFEDCFDDVPCEYLMKFPFVRPQELADLALQRAQLKEIENKARLTRNQKLIKEFVSVYGEEYLKPRPWKQRSDSDGLEESVL